MHVMDEMHGRFIMCVLYVVNVLHKSSVFYVLRMAHVMNETHVTRVMDATCATYVMYQL